MTSSSTAIGTLPAYLEEVLRIATVFKESAPPKECDGPWFRGANDRKHGLVPGAYWRKNVDEEALCVDFRDQAPSYYDGGGGALGPNPTNDWEWYFLMQHYGMPTRLLDWSENALVAMFFALADPGPAPCVWVLDPAQFNKVTLAEACIISPGGSFSDHWRPRVADEQKSFCEPGIAKSFSYKDKQYENAKPIAIYAARRNARILAQQGTFTLHGSEQRSIHELVGHVGSTPLGCIDIDATRREALIKQLELCGIMDYGLFPELERLAPYLKRRHEVTP